MKWIKQLLCRHVCFYEDMAPRDEWGVVRARCHKCGKEFEGPYGLCFPTDWAWRHPLER